MWMGHDLQWWGAVTGIAGFVIAMVMIPVSIFAPIFVPKLLNWWAERSVASLCKRILTLEATLARAEKVPMISEESHIILVSLQLALAILAYISLAAELILQFIIEIADVSTSVRDPLTHKLPHDIASLPLQAFIVFFVSIVITFIMMFTAGRIGGFLLLRSPQSRRRMMSSLQTLRAKANTRIGGAV